VSDGPAKSRALATRHGWRGDDHLMEVEAAKEAGLVPSEAALDSFTRGFSEGIAVEDPADGAIVARGRTMLTNKQLLEQLMPALRYLGVPREGVVTKVFDGNFELRIAKRVAESSNPVVTAGKLALQIWVGFGLLGIAAYMYLPQYVAGLLWGIGLLVGGWQLRQGLVTGRAMLAGRLAVGLATIAAEDKSILPPAEPS
jgi:hypothetical protein